MQGFDFQNKFRREDNLPRAKKSKFFLWLVIGTIVLGLAFLVAFAFAYKFYSTSQKVITENPPSSFLGSLKDIASPGQKTLRGETGGRINILLLGLAGDNYPGENLTDSIIVASIDPKTYQTAMLSIPRDFYVRIPGTDSYTKINALYARGVGRNGKTTDGIDDLKTALTEITGLPIHYYVALDFDGFKKFIDELGGIKVQVPKSLHDERYPGPNFSYETFDIKKGLYTLDGNIALKFARTRHDEDGDFGRAFRQQLILESARSKAFSIGTLIDIGTVNNILNILSDHLRTDIPLDELESFLDLSKKIDTHLTVNKILDAGKSDSLLAVSHVMMGSVRAFILVPRTGNYDEISDVAANIFDLELIKRKQKAVEDENASVAIVNASGSANFGQKLATLLKKMGFDAKIAESVEVSPRQDTVVFDISKTKPFSLEELSKKFSAEIENGGLASTMEAKPPTECLNADLCLVAGSDLTDSLNFEEGTVTDLENEYDHQQIDERQYIELLKKGSNKKY